jgi:hypothetical protein
LLLSRFDMLIPLLFLLFFCSYIEEEHLLVLLLVTEMSEVSGGYSSMFVELC